MISKKLLEKLKSIIGKPTDLIFFGKCLGRPDDNIYKLKKIFFSKHNLRLDYTHDCGYMVLKLKGITSSKFYKKSAKYGEIKINAKLVDLKWCFAPKASWPKIGISSWIMEKGITGIKSTEDKKWLGEVITRKFKTNAQALLIKIF